MLDDGPGPVAAAWALESAMVLAKVVLDADEPQAALA
jgi:hypothetical protein